MGKQLLLPHFYGSGQDIFGEKSQKKGELTY